MERFPIKKKKKSNAFEKNILFPLLGNIILQGEVDQGFSLDYSQSKFVIGVNKADREMSPNPNISFSEITIAFQLQRLFCTFLELQSEELHIYCMKKKKGKKKKNHCFKVYTSLGPN